MSNFPELFKLLFYLKLVLPDGGVDRRRRVKMIFPSVNSNILPLPDLITYQKLLFMHPIAHNQSVVQFPNFRKNYENQDHLYPLRNLNDFQIRRTNSQKLSKMPLIDLPNTWNSVDDSLKRIASKNIFRNKIKLELMNKCDNYRCNKKVCISCKNL